MNDQTTCPHCSKTFNKTLPACPFCGLDVIKEEKRDRELRCPRCRIPMETSEFRDVEIDICTGCAGIWLDTDEFKHVTSERDVYTDTSIPREYRKKPFPEDRGYLHCPLCDDLMSRKNFKTISGVLIDICSHHGIWLDAGELEQIRCFIAAGGLEKYQDKHIAANAEKIKTLADSLSGVEFTQWFIEHWNLKHILKEGLIPRRKPK